MPSVVEVDGSAPTELDNARTEPDPNGHETSSAPGRPAPGAVFGRYRIEEEVGAGGMGVVYRAHDPILERPVALKLVSSPAEDLASQRRSFREARVLAQVRHPNVVAVHDVGVIDDRVYIAMDLVDGEPLSSWQHGRDWRAVLQAYVAAGRGLAAAHERGLVHRDVKPGNILVDDRGRVTVVDFGLAVVADAERSATAPHDSNGDITTTSITDKITRIGAVVGTPRYMAPEQQTSRGLTVDARSDQYSLAVALLEAIGGRYPFAGDDDSELLDPGDVAARKRAGQITPVERHVPRRLLAALRKALSPRPDDRFESMPEFLGALRVRSPRTRAVAVGATALVALTATASFMLAEPDDAYARCISAGRSTADTWSSAERERVRAAFEGTGQAYASDAWIRVDESLRSYADGWTEVHAATCAARWRNATQSPELFDRSMSCLRDRALGFRALVGRFEQADSATVQRAVVASRELPRADACADARRLWAAYPASPDPTTQTRVAKVRESMAQLSALAATGAFKDALALSDVVQPRVDEASYPPARAEFLYRRGRILSGLGKYEQAEETLRDAAAVAADTRNPALLADAMLSLADVVGNRRSRLDEGLALATSADLAHRLNEVDDERRADLERLLGILHVRKADYDTALSHLRASIALDESNPTQAPLSTASARNAIGIAQRRQGNYYDALDTFRMVVDLYARGLGPHHPELANALVNKGLVLWNLGQNDLALTTLRQALSIYERTFDADDPRIGTALGNIGNIYYDQGRLADAESALARSVAIHKTALGPDHPGYATMLNNLGNVVASRGDHDRALDTFRESLRIRETSLGDDHPALAHPLSSMGAALFELRRLAEARATLERLVAFCDRTACDAEPHARGSFNLARVLVAQGKQRSRAVSLARRAAAQFSAQPVGAENQLAEVHNWWKREIGGPLPPAPTPP